MTEVPHVLIALAVAWSVLLLLLTAVAFLALLRMRVIEKGATSSNDLEINREYQVLNKLALPPELYFCLAYAAIPIMIFLFVMLVLKLYA